MFVVKIAIDGPAGAGKSTIARLVAQKLGLRYLDTGAMYRALTLEAAKKGVPFDEEEALLNVATAMDLEIVFERTTKKNLIYLNGEDVSQLIRQPEITANVSLVSSHKKVRDYIVALQKEIGKQGSIVMDGRDIGTVVMPDADWKIFLQASVEERARRRQKELEKNGHPVDIIELEEQLRKRDHFDSTRDNSPLKKSDDAVEVDTTFLEIDEVVEKVLGLIKEDKDV
ncbi:MAG: (d)CMP kinase [Firmicutes bacterium]|nr:(d)CMP kinase [Bacillota bacterium]